MTLPPPPDPDRTATALAGLGRELESLRRRLDDLDEIPAQIAELARIVAALGDRLATAPASAAAGIPSWLGFPEDLADPATATAVLSDLIAWMSAVYLRYDDAAAFLPECWLWHPDVIEELLWLRAAWAAAYLGPAASVTAAGDWHDRARPGVARRIRAAAGTCSAESHQVDGDRRRDAPKAPMAEAAAAIAAWWTTARGTCPPAPDVDLVAATGLARIPRRRG